MKNKPFYLMFSPGHGFKKNDVLVTGYAKNKLIILNPNCKQTWWRILFGKSDITGLLKVKYLKPSWRTRLRIKWKIFKWLIFEAEALRGYAQTKDDVYLRIARMARIKTITLKKQL